MKFILLLCLCACAVSGSYAATPQPKPIPCDISGLRYDPGQMKSEAYPIFLQAYGNDQLIVIYKGNGVQEFRLVFIRKNAKDAIAAIDKFFEWEQIAISRGETLSKKITGVATVSGSYIYVGFTSLSKDRHALQMGIRSKLLGDSSGTAAGIIDLLIDHSNAEKLKQLLTHLNNGEPLDKAADVYR